MSRIRISNPFPGGQKFTSMRKAIDFCNRGVAYFLSNGQLKFKSNQQSIRGDSDVYVDRRGTIFWNGARSHYIGDTDVAMFPPCCNVVFPKVGTARAARRYAG